MALLSDSWKIDILTVFIGAITILYLLTRRVYTYWDRRGIKSVQDVSYFFGHFKKSFLQKETFAESVDRAYKSTDDPFVGIYTVLRPVLLIRDPELIRSILVKDFSHFTDRGIHCNEDYDPLSANLLSLPGQRWRNLRGNLSPAFTSGKMRAMFTTILECGSTLQTYLGKLADKREILDVREISACYTTNVIASFAFGVSVDAINDPNNAFRVYGRKHFEPTPSNLIRDLFNFTAPKLMSLLRIRYVNSDFEHFIKSVVKENLEYREKNKVIRKDFFQLLVQLRNGGTVQSDDEWETIIIPDESQKTFTLNEVAAQTFIFFAAGFETSSSTSTFLLYEMAKNPEIQDKVHNEINTILKKSDGQLSYESISKMKYLENCIDETLRKYSAAPIVPRTCVEEYRIPGSDIVIEKGTEVFIPIFSLQRDEKYYENPKTFDPDRFNDDNSAGKNQVNRPYLPFGDGSRNCIGARLAKLQITIGLVMMLQKHRFELEDRLENDELKLDPKSFLLSPFGGLKLHVSKR